MIYEIFRGKPEIRIPNRRGLVRGAARVLASAAILGVGWALALRPYETQAQEADPNTNRAALIDNSQTRGNYIAVNSPLENPLSLGNKLRASLEVNYQTPETPSDAQVTLLTILKRTPENDRAYNFAMGLDLSREDDSASFWARSFARRGERDRADEVVPLAAESEEGIVVPGQWNEFSVELEGAQNRCSIRLFVNGEEVRSNSVTLRNCQIVSEGAGAITLGFPIEGFTRYGDGNGFTGMVDNLRIEGGLVGEQTNPQIPGFFVPWSTNKLVSLLMDGNFEDVSGNENIGRAIGEVSFAQR